MLPRISILGAGHSGCALAVDLHARGFEVLLHAHPCHRRQLDAIEHAGRLRADGVCSATCRPTTTTSLQRALEHADRLLITLPAYAHEELITSLASHDLRRHTLVCITGNFFALAARHRLDAQAIVETSTSPFSCRVNGHTVYIKGRKAMMYAAALGTLGLQQRQAVEALFPQPLVWLPSVLANSLSCVTGVMHPTPALMNAGRIESTGGDFHFYREGMTAGVARVMSSVDTERLLIADSLGITLPPALNLMNDYYRQSFGSLAEFARESVEHNSRKSAPDSLTHRYLMQDVPYVLVPWRALARRMGVATPTIDAVIQLTAQANSIALVSGSRTLRRLGLHGLEPQQLRALARGEDITGVRGSSGRTTCEAVAV